MTTTTENLNDFVAAAEKANQKAALTGIEGIESACRRIRIVLFGGPGRAVDRVKFIRELQDSLGLLISAEGRQTLVEDFRVNRSAIFPPPPPRTRDNLVAAVEQAAMELTRYTEDSEDDTDDYYTGDHSECDDAEDSDDPPTCAAEPAKVHNLSDFSKTKLVAGRNIMDYPNVQILPPAITPNEQRALEEFFRDLTK
jgi:hypothetical protein